MRRRCNGAPTQWLIGIILTALGVGILLACLLPKCTLLVGGILAGIGIWLLRQNGNY